MNQELPDAPASRPQLVARAGLALTLVLLGLWTLQTFLPALVWAGIFAIALWPLYRRARRRWPPGRHNLLLPITFTLAIALVFLIPLALLGMQVGQDAHGVFLWAREAERTGVPVPAFVAKLPFGTRQLTQWWQDNLAAPRGASILLGRLDQGSLMTMGRDLTTQLTHRAVLFAFTLLTVFFLFRDGESLSAQMLRGSRRFFGPRGERIGRQMIASVHGTVDGLVLVGLGEGLIMGIAYAVAGVPRPALLGALTAVAAMIPFGAVVAFGLAAALALAQGAVVAAIAVFVTGLVVLTAADHVVRPVLIGGATRLPFLWVLFGILGGVEAWGLLGLFLGPAIMAALVLLWREWTEEPDRMSAAPASRRMV